MATSSSQKPARDEFVSYERPTVPQSLPRTKPTRTSLTDRSESLFSQAATIRSGFTSPTPTASSAFPTGRATPKPKANLKRSSPSCRTATGTRPGTLPSPTTTSGCWYRSVRKAMTERESEARQEDCDLGAMNTRSAQAGRARPTAPPCWRSIPMENAPVSSRPVSVIVWVSPCTPRAAMCIAPPMSVTGWETIWCRTTLPGCAKGRSTAGPGSISAATKTRGTPANVPT